MGGGGPGGTLIFSYMRRLGPFLGVQNNEFQYFLDFQKNEYLFGYEDFVDIFFLRGGGGWGHHKTGLFLEVSRRDDLRLKRN